MPQVARTRTPFSMAVLSDVLGDVWRQTFPSVPFTSGIRALVLALVDLEVAAGESAYNWNLGNLVSTSETQPFFTAVDAGNARRFVAYGSLQDGARAVLKLLMSPNRPHWREGLLSGDPSVFVRSLGGEFGGPRYFEANVDRYLKTFRQRWERYKPTAARRSASRVTPAGGGGTLAVIALGALVVAAVLSMGAGR